MMEDDEGGEESVAPPSRYGSATRVCLGIIAGVVAGSLLSNSIQAGLVFHFPEEQADQAWSPFLWGEHWALRVPASWLATLGDGFIAAVIARRRGQLAAVLSAVPTATIWLLISIMASTEHIPFVGEYLPVDVSIGNKLAAGLLVLSTLPVAASAGHIGGEAGMTLAGHFDSRRYSLLGIKWFHFFWLPILIHFVFMQAEYTGLYGLGWLQVMWRAGLNTWGFGALLPSFFCLALWGTFLLMWGSMSKCYEVLGGFDQDPGLGEGEALGSVSALRPARSLSCGAGGLPAAQNYRERALCRLSSGLPTDGEGFPS